MPSYPVGYIDTIEMYSLDFEDFLWANCVLQLSSEHINKTGDSACWLACQFLRQKAAY